MAAAAGPAPPAPHLPAARERRAHRRVPWEWSVYSWLPGEPATTARLDRPHDAALGLAGFVDALRRIDARDGPPPGDHNVFRGEPLAARDDSTRGAIAALAGQIDAERVTAGWDAALSAAEWHGPPAWIHGDLAPGNLLVVEGRLTSVIDFGCLGVGDPACDLMIAWTLFAGDARSTFRDALVVDDASWARGRGWALLCALGAIPYYADKSPELVREAWRTIGEVLDGAAAAE
jgi:aminoglycoside phosphotransferase (APT) family kinase protein